MTTNIESRLTEMTEIPYKVQNYNTFSFPLIFAYQLKNFTRMTDLG